MCAAAVDDDAHRAHRRRRRLSCELLLHGVLVFVARARARVCQQIKNLAYTLDRGMCATQVHVRATVR